jgi:transcriptional regulator with XRE-family HTH domain
MDLAKVISKNIRASRERVGLSQRELADRTGISARYISQLENGAPNVTVEVLDKLARGLNCTANQLVHDGRVKAPAGAVHVINEVIRLLKSLRSQIKPTR